MRIGKYALVEQLGRPGGMGTAWLATDDRGNSVALKLMHSHAVGDDDLVRRFRQEFEIGQRFRHPNLVRMLDQGTVDGLPFLVMELAQGKTLRRLLERGGTFREGEVATFVAEAAAGLAVLHAGGVVHRDLSATNLMVDRDLSAKIIDYGIARQLGGLAHTQAGGFMGKAEYAAPELYHGRPAGPEADIYALGILAFECLAGHVPFRAGRYVDVLRLHAERPVPSLSAEVPLVSLRMERLVGAMLEKQPARRPAAAMVEREARAIAADAGMRPPRHSLTPVSPQPHPRASVPHQQARTFERTRIPADRAHRGSPGRGVKVPIVVGAIAGLLAVAGVMGIVVISLASGG